MPLSKPAISWVWYILPLLLLQLPFAFSPMCVWDSAVQQHLYNSQNLEGAKKLFFDSSVPLSYFEMLPFALLPSFVVPFKLFIVFIFSCTTLLIAGILRRFRYFTETEIYFISVLTFFYPAYALWLHFIMLPYYISFLAFTGALYLILQYEEAKAIKNLPFIVLLMLIAFNIQSFMVLLLALLALRYLLSPAFRLVCRKEWVFYGGLFALPFLYYFLLGFFFPREGFYREDGYNTFVLNPLIVGTEMAKSIFNGSITPLMAFVKYLISDPLSSLVYLFSSFLLVTLIYRRIHSPASAPFDVRVTLAFSILACAALLPYALVGKHISTHGYETRHSLLFHTPFLMAISMLSRLLKRHQRWVLPAVLGFSVFMFLKQQIHWENRYAKYQEVVSQLKSMGEEKLGNVVFFNEGVNYWDMDEYLRFYECNMMLMDAFGNQKHLGISDLRERHATALVEKYEQKYLKYRSVLFFKDYFHQEKISEIRIEERPCDDFTLFITTVLNADASCHIRKAVTVTLLPSE